MNSNKQVSFLALTALLLSACGSQVALPPFLSGPPSAPPPAPVSAPASVPDPSIDAANLPRALSLSVGEDLQVPVTMNGQVPSAGLLSWQSSDPRIVAVTASGLLSAYQPGAVQVKIVQTGKPERSYILEVTVQAPPVAMPKPPALTAPAPAPVTPAPPQPAPPAPAPAPPPTPPAPTPVPVSAPPAPAPTPPPAPTPALPAPAPTPAPPPPTPAPASSSGFTSDVLRLVNVARAAGGSCGGVAYAPAAALSWSTLLANSAQAHASDMAARNYFDHTNPDGRTFDQRITAAGYQWRSVAENIAAGQKTPADVVTGWLGSTGHCKNIFNPVLSELGVGYFEGGSYRKYWVQNFGTPR